MTFFINLATNAVTAGLYDGASQPGGWFTTAGQSDNVQIQFHWNGVPALLPAGTPILFGCKALDQFDSPNYLTSAAAFTTPTSATGFYTAWLPTNTPTINTALGSTDGGNTAGDTVSVLETSCEIDWWLNGPANPPSKSQPFSVQINNTPVRGGEAELGSSTVYPPPAPVAALVANVAALTAIAGMYNAGFFLFAPFSFDFRQQRNSMYAGIL